MYVFKENTTLLFCSCLVPDTGFLLCFPLLIGLVQKIKISSGGKKRICKNQTIRCFKLKPAFGIKAKHTMDSALRTAIQDMKTNKVTPVSS